MYLLRRFRHACERGTETGALIRVVAEALRRAGHDEPRFHAFFSDDKLKKISAIERLIDHHPELVTTGTGTPTALATMPGAAGRASETVIWRIAPFDLDTAIAIADGIPKRYPFHESHFLVTPVPAFELTTVTRRTTMGCVIDADHAEIIVHSAARSPRREVHISSAVATDAPPPASKRAPALPPSVKQLIEALGKPGKEDQRLVRDSAEEAAVRARADALEPQIVALTEALDASWATFAFKHDLVDDHRHEEHDMNIRTELANALRPEGWAQASGGFRKRTTSDHELLLSYDRAPLGNQTWTALRLRGADWEHTVSLWPRRTQKDLRIRSRRTANAYAQNIALAAAHAIATWASPVETLYGTGDAWLPRRR